VMKGEWGALAAALAATDDPEERKEKLQAWRMAGVPKAALDALQADPSSFTMTPAQKADDALAASGQQITVRGQDMSAATARSGQAITMRGQDMSAATAREGQAVTRRGQDMTDARAAKTGAEGAKLSAAAVEKVAGADTALGSAAKIAELLPSFEGSLGPVYGRVQQAKQGTALADSGYAEFAAEVATLKNAVVKATTGAAMSEAEAVRILEQVPDLTQQPAVFKARLATTKRNIQKLRDSTITLSGGEPMVPAPGEITVKQSNPFRKK
jgi:hypothetical protein